MEISIDEEKAKYVRLIFEMTVKRGYGSYRMAEYLNKLGVKTSNGSKFQCNTINRILKNKLYCGYIHNGNACSGKLYNLEIIEEELFNQAQDILAQRSHKESEKSHIAKNTKGKTLLSGNIFCASCGARMNATSYTDKYKRKDGTMYEVRKQRYICTGKTRNNASCEGQVAYVSTKIDETISEIVCEYLNKIKTTPKSVALERKYHKEISLCKSTRKKLVNDTDKLRKKLKGLTDEISKSLMGESKFSPDILSEAIESAKSQIRENEQKLTDLELKILDGEVMTKKLDHYYTQFRAWSDEFLSTEIEQRKMIICQLISRIEFRRGYELNIEFNTDYEQFL